MRSISLQRLALALAVCAGAAGTAGAPHAQEAPPLTERGAEYEETARRARIATELRYPGEVDLENATDPATERRVERPEAPNPDAERWGWAIVVCIALAVIVFVVIRFGGSTSIAFRRVGDGRRGDVAEERAVIDEAGGLRGFLARLRAMTDRPAALVLLIQGALERAGQLTGTPVIRSQTAREVLRRLPRDWSHHPALRRIVQVEEVVQFGGRDLSDRVFEECLDLAEPLFAEDAR